MTCPYYKWRDNFFFGDYFCTKQDKEVNSDIYQRYCKNYSYDDCPVYKQSSSSGGCYLTTACVEHRGLPDDCHALQTLRQFRDNWLKNQPGGLAEIAEYYRIGPAVVDGIEHHERRTEILEQLGTELVDPCVKLIEEGQFEEAHALYQNCTLQLKDAFGID